MNDIILLNGKTLEKALEEVSRYKAKSREKAGKWYWGIDEYVSRMNEVFGRSGYSASYRMEPYFVFPLTNQVVLNATCTLRIFGKDGSVVYETMGLGGVQIERLSKEYQSGGRSYTREEAERLFNGLNNVPYNAQTSAFKSACKSLDIFGSATQEEGGKGNESSRRNSSGGSGSSSRNGSRSGSGSGAAPADAIKMDLYVNEKIVHVKDDPKTNEPIYRMYAYQIIKTAENPGGAYGNKKLEIVFYPNRYKGCKEAVMSLVNKNTPFKTSILIAPIKDDSYYFAGF